MGLRMRIRSLFQTPLPLGVWAWLGPRRLKGAWPLGVAVGGGARSGEGEGERGSERASGASSQGGKEAGEGGRGSRPRAPEAETAAAVVVRPRPPHGAELS